MLTPQFSSKIPSVTLDESVVMLEAQARYQCQTKFWEDITPEDLQRKIESGSNNIGFVIGKLLRNLWDNTIVPLAKTCCRWFSEHSAIMNRFDNSLTKIIRLEKAPDLSNPQALVVFSEKEKLFNEVRPFNDYKKLMLRLSMNYHVVQKHIANNEEFCEAIKSTSIYGPIKILILYGHDSPEGISLGGETSQENSLLVSSYFLKSKQDLSCLRQLKNVKIILVPCNTAGENIFKFTFSNHTVSFNIQELIASQVPGSEVYAPKYFLHPYSVSISHMPTFEIAGTGIRELTKINNLKEASLFWLNVLVESPLVRSFALRPFEVVSPGYPPCRSVLHYYKMKEYCDEGGTAPSKEEIKKCLDSQPCRNVVNFFENTHRFRKNYCSLEG